MTTELTNEEIIATSINNNGYNNYRPYLQVELDKNNLAKVEDLTQRSYKLNLILPMIKMLKFLIERCQADPAHLVMHTKSENGVD
jgi:hypothetical protein